MQVEQLYLIHAFSRWTCFTENVKDGERILWRNHLCHLKTVLSYGISERKTENKVTLKYFSFSSEKKNELICNNKNEFLIAKLFSFHRIILFNYLHNGKTDILDFYSGQFDHIFIIKRWFSKFETGSNWKGMTRKNRNSFYAKQVWALHTHTL